MPWADDQRMANLLAAPGEAPDTELEQVLNKAQLHRTLADLQAVPTPNTAPAGEPNARASMFKNASSQGCV